MPLRLSPSIARVRRAASLNYLDVNLNCVDGDALVCSANMTLNGLRNPARNTLDICGNAVFWGTPTRNLELGRDNDSGSQTVSPSNEVILLIAQKPSHNGVAASLCSRRSDGVAPPWQHGVDQRGDRSSASVNNSTNSLGTASSGVLGGKRAINQHVNLKNFRPEFP